MTKGVDWAAVEEKWRRRWAERGDFEADPDGARPKKFITVAYPYPNSPQHVGHGRTYTLADVHARYSRMRGFNVLFPMGFHYTGTPILGMARRVQENDPDTMGGLRGAYGVPEEEIEKFKEPLNIARYFHREIRAGMVEMGYSIDWRREFTTIDPAYSRFVEWQVGVLRARGLIVQGSHPVGWCPRDQNPVSQHDTLGDVEPDFTEYTLVRFAGEGGEILPAATLRPETLFGATNLWVNPGAEYARAEVDGEEWVVSPECARKLEFLGRKVEVKGTVKGADLVGSLAAVPAACGAGGRKVPVLPAGFVEPGTGTGLVMSVPAHAPFDWRALADLREAGDAAAANLRPVRVIESGGGTAEEACGRAGARSQADAGALEKATAEVYGGEFYGGTMAAAGGAVPAELAGVAVREARESAKAALGAGPAGAATMLELTNAPVRCRCGSECVVKVLSDQWFLDYANEQWKEKARRCLGSLSVLPPEIRGEFDHVMGWLRERACARQRGMGTRLPWDGGWIVESLSDSVIYMAYYTIARFVNSGALPAGCLTPALLDHVFLGGAAAGDAAAAAEAGADGAAVRAAREEFEHFYPVDARHSGRDLVPNHLSFFVLNHAAIFPESRWPRQIVVNGSVLMGGKKMSKSMGNVMPLRDAVRRHGADPIRLAIISSAELLQDAEFAPESVAGAGGRLEAMLAGCSNLGPGPLAGGAVEAEDRWLLSRLRGAAADAAGAVEKMRLREALHSVLFSLDVDLQWHARRAAAKGRSGEDTAPVLRRVAAARASMLSPFAPHAADEMWERLGLEGAASLSSWPEFPEGWDDPAAAQAEGLLRRTVEDVSKITRVAGIGSPKRILVYAAGDAKRAAHRAILEIAAGGEGGGKGAMGAAMKALAADPLTAGLRRDPGFVQKAIRDVLSETPAMREAMRRAPPGGFDELGTLERELGGLAAAAFGGAEVAAFSESDPGAPDPGGKARHARPFRPAIFVE